MDTVFALFPVVALIWSMTKARPLTAHVALPLAALCAVLIQWGYFQADALTLLANIIAGGLAVLTPVSIIAGAILLNRVLVISGAEQTLRQWLAGISPNPVAQLMVIGWAFAFMLEGASGFGTPAAIAAPILVGLGFPALPVALLTLVMNSVPVSFGAVGTPAWFGFAGLALAAPLRLEVAQWTALIHLCASFVIPVIALRWLVSWREVWQNSGFILMSIVSCTAPFFLIAQINDEFPSLLGGAIGLLISIWMAKLGVGLHQTAPVTDRSSIKPPSNYALVQALLPFVLLIIILLVTRIPSWPFKGWLNDTSLWWQFGAIEVSRALVVAWPNILGTNVDWSYKALYVPAIIPFVLTVAIMSPILSLSKSQIYQASAETWGRLKRPILALMGALIMVSVMMQGAENAPIFVIANALASVVGANWAYVAALLGALGSFFSGSATVSNLTFGGIQLTIATQTGLPVSVILALQSVGAAMGNMVCLNNIIAVASILGIQNQEGAMIKQTLKPLLVYAVVAALLGQVILTWLI